MAGSFAEFILFHARSEPAKPAIILVDRVATYGMLAQGMLRVEDRLRALALPAGELVCVTLASPIRHLIVAAALFRLGLPVVSAARASDVAGLGLPIRAFLHDAGEPIVPGLRQALVNEAWFAGGDRTIPASRPDGSTDPDAICRIEISSGTTGRPKAISLTNRAFEQRQTVCYTTINAGAWNRLLSLPGLNGAWGFVLGAHALRAGRTLVVAESPRDALDMISLYGVDALAASIQQLRDMVGRHQRSPVPCHSLRVTFASGGLLSPGLAQQVQARLCSHIVVQYASSEMGATAAGPFDDLADGAIGAILPGVEVEVVGDEGAILAAGAEGTLRIRTPWAGEPYPPGTAAGHAGFRDGWFYPGDRGLITPAGRLAVSGRDSEVINSGGVKKAPEFVEEVVLRHESVADAAAFGVVGASGVAEIAVAVAPRAPIDERTLIDWCRRRGLEVARVFVVDQIPRTPMGKIRRDELKAKLLA
jgi:acyl-CoA synthetase (AMP-forming)/AMP-acid ligase II